VIQPEVDLVSSVWYDWTQVRFLSSASCDWTGSKIMSLRLCTELWFLNSTSCDWTGSHFGFARNNEFSVRLRAIDPDVRFGQFGFVHTCNI